MGKDVCMLVRVHVSELDPTGLDLANLRFRFPLNFFFSDFALPSDSGEIFQAGAEQPRSICQSRKTRGNGHAINQYHVASSLELGEILGSRYSVRERRRVGHESG